MKECAVLLAVFSAFTVSINLQAQPLVNIETVSVGDPGNAADTRPNSVSFGRGAVPYRYRIGKYEVTINQYTAFLNSVARINTNTVIGDPNNYIEYLWKYYLTNNLNIAGISRDGSGTQEDPYRYSVIGSGNRPITYVSWFDAARFCNWLHNGATNGASTETGAYTLNGATAGIIAKNAEATWWIPSEDEWFKAAYYKGGFTNTGYWLYPTQSDTRPGNDIGGAANQANYYSGVYAVTQSSSYSSSQNYLTDGGAFSNSASAYGTFDQGGNVWEWTDAVIGSDRGIRGASWALFQAFGAIFIMFPESTNGPLPVSPDLVYHDIGFRVATAAPPITNVILSVEKTTNLSGQWQFDSEINAGPMTNTNEFYRLKIRTVVE
jgi:sulfatase modifying factor 1